MKLREGADAVVFRTLTKILSNSIFQIKLYFYRYSLYRYEFETAVENRRTA